jgi:deglycase
MANILMLIDNNYEDTEALYPYYRMLEAGHSVTVVGSPAGTYTSKHGYPIKADKSPSDIDIKKFQALIIPGGQAPDKMRTKPDMVKLVKEAVKRDIIIGAICHAAQMLIEAEAVKGKKATCYISVSTDLKNAGGIYEDSPVVVDGKLVTSRHPGDLPDFCRTLVEMIK